MIWYGPSEVPVFSDTRGSSNLLSLGSDSARSRDRHKGPEKFLRSMPWRDYREIANVSNAITDDCDDFAFTTELAPHLAKGWCEILMEAVGAAGAVGVGSLVPVTPAAFTVPQAFWACATADLYAFSFSETHSTYSPSSVWFTFSGDTGRRVVCEGSNAGIAQSG